MRRAVWSLESGAASLGGATEQSRAAQSSARLLDLLTQTFQTRLTFVISCASSH